MKDLNNIVEQFDIRGTVSEIKPLGNGLINDTYIVRTAGEDTPDYVLQRINHHIFTNVEVLQHNIQAVTSHIRRKLEAAGEDDLGRKVLEFVTIKDGGKTFYFDGESYWRIMVFIPRSKTFEAVTP
ncbi:MAG: aminoglycoside phosphotransferase, partial [Muribaculaceae bacterium]|nr:aminoglycoside phosphotransferase [Muribaculaceae bacterium]